MRIILRSVFRTMLIDYSPAEANTATTKYNGPKEIAVSRPEWLRRPAMNSVLIFVQLTVAASLCAQQGHPQAKDQDRISGVIVSIVVAQQNATITIESGKGKISHTVSVKMEAVTYANKPATLAEVKKGRTLNCMGGNHDAPDKQSTQFVARTCTVK